MCQEWMVATRKGSKTPNQKLQRMGREMYRRMLGALQLGTRTSEMLLIQVKHVNNKTWEIKWEWDDTKGGKMTGEAESMWAMTPELQAVLEERRALGPDAYIFGNDDGTHCKKFYGTWRKLFRAAGLPDGLIWCVSRHEFVSDLIDRGGNIQEVRDAARHRSITTTARYMKAQQKRVQDLLQRKSLKQLLDSTNAGAAQNPEQIQ